MSKVQSRPGSVLKKPISGWMPLPPWRRCTIWPNPLAKVDGDFAVVADEVSP